MEAQEKRFKERIELLIQKEPEGLLPSRLNEKGVECALLLPLLEEIMEFDPLLDIEYEFSSEQKNGQRFDFLLDGDFVIEAKSLNVDISGKIDEQLVSYIKTNDKIDYGFISNGWEYSFYLKKKYIERIDNEGNDIPEAIEAVYKVLNITINDDKFIQIMKSFSKREYKATFKSIAKYVHGIFDTKIGKRAKIHEDKEIDAYIKRIIDSNIETDKGYYFNDIVSKKINVLQKMSYKCREFEILVEVQKDGRVKLPKDGIKILNMPKLMEERKYMEMLRLVVTEWSTKDTIFDSPYDIILQCLGRKNKYKDIEKDFPFN